MATVELVHLEKRFGHVAAVSDLNLGIEAGELMVLVGPSGCGKSTVLRMIAGLEQPTGGQVRIGGQRMNEVPPKDRDLAMVFQSYALYPHLTVRRNLGFALELRRRPRAEIQARVAETAATLGLSELLDRKPAALSGGQRQRVALGRAIIRHPKVFLFDEPLSNLDAKLRNQMRAELVHLHHRLEATMIYVTHDQVEAMTMGDRIAVLDGGRLQQVDRPLALYHEPRNLFVAGFIGTPAMNLIGGEAENGAFRSAAVSFPLPATVRDAAARAGRLVLGLRPEHLKLAIRAAAANASTDWGANVVQGEGGRAQLCGRLKLIELLGAETYAHAEIEGELVVARLGAGEPPAIDGPIALAFDPEAGHYFAAASGERLGAAPAPAPGAPAPASP
jgi:multiple sugar transport system ATP-binding protein